MTQQQTMRPANITCAMDKALHRLAKVSFEITYYGATDYRNQRQQSARDDCVRLGVPLSAVNWTFFSGNVQYR